MGKWTPRGQMRRQITIERIDTTADANGETTGTAILFSTVWAMIEPLGGRELFLAKAQQDTSSHRLRIPYVAGVDQRMRAKYQGRVFNFTSISDIGEQHRELEILATEVLP